MAKHITNIFVYSRIKGLAFIVGSRGVIQLGRDSGNDFWIPEIGLDIFYFRILMSFLVVSLNDRHFLELTFVSGAD